MSDIPQDIITQILTLLSPKSLLRFRCVCKPWRILIDTPQFIKLHLNQTLKYNLHQRLLLSDFEGIHLSNDDFDSVFVTNIAKFHQINPPVKCHILEVHVMGCCNGLVLLRTNIFRNRNKILLWNPCTRKFRKLPDFGECGIRLYLGFGYDDVHDDYKVVNIVEFNNPIRAQLNVYSSNSNTLGKVQTFPYRLIDDGCGVFVAGALHWTASTGFNVEDRLIVGFNLITERIHLVSQPQPDCLLVKELGFRMSLAVLGGSLCLTNYYKTLDTVDIWIMKDYGNKESWTKMASLVNSVPKIFQLCPISFSNTGKQILLAENDEALVCYDIEEKSVTNVKLQAQLDLYFLSYVYCGSLVHLKHM